MTEQASVRIVDKHALELAEDNALSNYPAIWGRRVRVWRCVFCSAKFEGPLTFPPPSHVPFSCQKHEEAKNASPLELAASKYLKADDDVARHIKNCTLCGAESPNIDCYYGIIAFKNRSAAYSEMSKEAFARGLR